MHCIRNVARYCLLSPKKKKKEKEKENNFFYFCFFFFQAEQVLLGDRRFSYEAASFMVSYKKSITWVISPCKA